MKAMIVSLILRLANVDNDPLDKEIVQEILDYSQELRFREDLKSQIGCPFEPGTYWNLECA